MDNKLGINFITDDTVIRIDSTPSYGYLYPDSNYFDDQEYFGDSILNYKLFQVKIWYSTIENVQCISGFQAFYKNRDTGDVVSPGQYKANDTHDGVETITLVPGEYFVDFKVAVDKKITNIELISNKNKYKVGGNTGEVKLTPLSLGPKVILATFANYTNCITCMGVYYMSRPAFLKVVFSGFFYLRFALKNKEFKEKVINYADKLSKENKAILKICLLGDITFLSVMRYFLII